MADDFQAEPLRDPRHAMPPENGAEGDPEDNPFCLTERRSPLPAVLIGAAAVSAILVAFVGVLTYRSAKPRGMFTGVGRPVTIPAPLPRTMVETKALDK